MRNYYRAKLVQPHPLFPVGDREEVARCRYHEACRRRPRTGRDETAAAADRLPASWRSGTEWNDVWAAERSALRISSPISDRGTKGDATNQLRRYTVSLTVCRKVLKQIEVGDLLPDETVGAVKEAQLLAKVYSLPLTTVTFEHSLLFFHKLLPLLFFKFFYI